MVMAAGGSEFAREGRRGLQGRIVLAARLDLEANVPLTPAEVAAIDSLEDLTSWLGTFRERLRIADIQNREPAELTVRQLEARFRQRRAELS